MESFRIRRRDRRVGLLKFNYPQERIWARVAPKIDAGEPIRLVILKARREGVCLDSRTRVLTADLRWKKISELEIGQELVSVDENAPGGKSRLPRSMRLAVVESRRDVSEVAYRIAMEDGRELIATAPHRFLSRRRGGTDTQWRSVDTLRVGDVFRTVTEPWDEGGYEDGWIGGLIDGEATLRPKSRAGCELTITQLPGAVYDRTMRYLKDRDYHPRESLDDYPRSHNDGYNRRPIGRIVVGRLNELFRIIGQTRPVRIPTQWWQGKNLPGKRSGVAWVRITAIEWLGRRRMVDLQTSTKTFLAEGFVSHNSTLIEALLMTFIAESDYVNALVTAHRKRAAQKIMGIAKLYVRSSPLLSRVATFPTDAIAIGHSMLEVTTAGSPDSERGGDLTAWHGSETSRYPFPAIMTATMQSLPDDPSIFSIGVLESTANKMTGIGRLFYQEWQRAVQGRSGWMAEFIGWHEMPDYRIAGARIDDADAEERELRIRFELSDPQLAWRRRKIAGDLQGDVDRFRQEYPAYAEEAFIVSGGSFFRPLQLLPMREHLRPGKRYTIETDGRLNPDPKGYLEIFRMPEPGHTYVIGSDSSMGLGEEDDDDEGDHKSSHSRSGAEVLDMETLEQMAEYDASTPPHIMARHLAGMGRLYNMALLAPEVQSSGGGGGRELLVFLHELGYWNIHQANPNADKVAPTPKIRLGWETNSASRPRMLARIREVVHERSSVIHSERLFGQLSHFGENDVGRKVALVGHDDLLFAYGIALMSRSENFFKMPSSAPQPQMPDWKSLGIRVSGPGLVMDGEEYIRKAIEKSMRRERDHSFLAL